jgi:hypothetical protein
MAVALMRWPQCLLCEEFSMPWAIFTIGAGTRESFINHRRDNVLRT